MRDAHIIRLSEEYRDILPIAQRYAEILAAELHHLMKHHGISLAAPIEHRVKTWASIEHKFVRANYDNMKIRFSGASLSDLGDLIGIRIILLFKQDMKNVHDILQSVFRVTDSEDKGKYYSYDQFGYTSVHYMVRLHETWLSVPTFGAFRNLQAEIQVRTLAQHMWAATSHKLQYKQEESVPEEMRRSIHRISSLLELIDEEYDRLLTERDDYRSKLHIKAKRGRLNSDVVESILDEQLPRQNKDGYEPYSLLCWELGKLGINTAEKLEALIAKHLSAAIEEDKKVARPRQEGSLADDRSRAGVFFTHLGLMTIMLEKEFGLGFHGLIFDKVESEVSSEAGTSNKPAHRTLQNG